MAVNNALSVINSALTAVSGALSAINSVLTAVSAALTISILLMFCVKNRFDDSQRRVDDDHKKAAQAVINHNQLFTKNTQLPAQEYGRKKFLSAAAIQCCYLRLKKIF